MFINQNFSYGRISGPRTGDGNSLRVYLRTDIAAEHDIYAYDAYLLRCALKYRSPLLTLDRGLRHVADQLSVRMLEVE